LWGTGSEYGTRGTHQSLGDYRRRMAVDFAY
jgi:hypothetical protein